MPHNQLQRKRNTLRKLLLISQEVEDRVITQGQAKDCGSREEWPYRLDLSTGMPPSHNA